MPKISKNNFEKDSIQETQKNVLQNFPQELKLVDVKELQKMPFCPFDEALLASLRKKGTGPKFLRINRRVFYDLDDFRTWVRNNLGNGQQVSQ